MRLIGVLVFVVLLVVPTACSDGSATSQSSPTATVAPPVAGTPDCAAGAELKASLDALTNVKPLQDGLTALNTAMADVKTSLGAALASASAALRPAVESVRAAFAELETAASGLSADTFRQKAPAINSALRQVGTAASSFGTTLTQSCPGS